MNEDDTETLDLKRVRKTLEKLKELEKSGGKKKSVKKQKQSAKEQSVESEEYRDDFPPSLNIVPAKNSSFYSFALEQSEEKEEENQKTKEKETE